jgi:hypothetical protein
MSVSLGQRLVPEEALKDKYRESLAWLDAMGALEPPGDYLEFGVFNGTSFLCMHDVSRENGLQDMRMFGFESFEGLPPEAAVDGWLPGDFSIDFNYTRHWLTERGLDWDRATLIKGWYSETLTPSFIEANHIDKVSVVMFDCNAYSSTKEALAFCMPLLGRHSVLIFDDWNAMTWRTGTTARSEPWMSTSPRTQDMTSRTLAATTRTRSSSK